MKKTKRIIALVAMTMILGMGTNALAATREAFFCDQCGAYLQSGSSYLESYTEYHTHQTEYVDYQGNPIYANCSCFHTRNAVGKICPTHGVRWSGVWHTENHSYSEVGYFGYWEE